jgi:hypothetical protein
MVAGALPFKLYFLDTWNFMRFFTNSGIWVDPLSLIGRDHTPDLPICEERLMHGSFPLFSPACFSFSHHGARGSR